MTRRLGTLFSIRRHAQRPAMQHRDEGMVLPLVFVGTILVSVITVGVATYVATDLRYSNVVENRADRLAAADGGLRFGIEKLRNFQSLCTTGAGSGSGVTTAFPPQINGADTRVTCQQVGTPISDIQGWGVVVTGEGVPASEPLFITNGAGQSDNVKTFSGPVYISDPSRLDFKALMKIKDGDLWYSAANCDTPPVIPELADGSLTFDPAFFRGPQCVPMEWDGGLFDPPTVPDPPTSPVNPGFTDVDACRVFSPGKYTSLTLGTNNYFKAGAYYLENVEVELQNKRLTAGFPSTAGDAQKIDNAACSAVQDADRAATMGSESGATFYLGGTSRFAVKNNAGLEIYRRLVGETYLSVSALPATGTGFIASSLDWSTWILETQSGSTNDVAIHGLVWAPKGAASLGNITQAANGQLLGGIVIALLDTQASASASAFLIGIESNPIDTRLLLTSTATLDGCSTVIKAVVQFRPDTGDLAVNSWRVTEQPVCT
jgi:Tfp pilus assembly protein PilX